MINATRCLARLNQLSQLTSPQLFIRLWPVVWRIATLVSRFGATISGRECFELETKLLFPVQPVTDRPRRQRRPLGSPRRPPSKRSSDCATFRLQSRLSSNGVNDHLRDLFSQLEGTENRIDPQWGVPSFNVIYQATHLYSGNGPFFKTQ